MSMSLEDLISVHSQEEEEEEKPAEEKPKGQFILQRACGPLKNYFKGGR